MIALLAEDNKNVAALVSRLLAPICKKVLVAYSYQELHEVIQKEDNLSMAALDVFLPDGRTRECLDAIRYIRAKFPRCIIMVWSGFTEATEEDMTNAGADGFLRKGAGFCMDNLFDLLLEAMSRRKEMSTTPVEDIDFNIRVMEHIAEMKKSKSLSK